MNMCYKLSTQDELMLKNNSSYGRGWTKVINCIPYAESRHISHHILSLTTSCHILIEESSFLTDVKHATSHSAHNVTGSWEGPTLHKLSCEISELLTIEVNSFLTVSSWTIHSTYSLTYTHAHTGAYKKCLRSVQKLWVHLNLSAFSPSKNPYRQSGNLKCWIIAN